MAANSGSAGKHPDQVLLDHKKKITEMVRLRFARYGDDALAIMLGYAMQPTRMPTLLERLEMRVATQNFEDQLDAISNWVNEWGAMKFKQRALAEKKKEVAPIQLGPIDQAIIAGPEPAAPQTAVAQAGQVPARAATPPPADSLPAKPQGPVVNFPGYSGTDRRGGSERRNQPDRRAGLMAISSNKRFGGDRRKNPKGRRQEDQRKPDYWWKYLVNAPPPQTSKK